MANWRDNLSDDTNEAINQIVKRIAPYQDAYNQSAHVRTSQLWCALAELQKELKVTQERLHHSEMMVNQLRASLRKSGESLSRA